MAASTEKDASLGGAANQTDVGSATEVVKVPTLAEIRGAIPKQCFKHYVPYSLFLVLRDGMVMASIFLFATTMLRTPGLSGEPLAVWEWLGWVVYGFVQGSAAVGWWVLAHECGHGGFSQYSMLNDAVGWVLHSFLLVPYFSWKYSHSKHHSKTNHLIDGETHVPETRESLTMVGFGLLHRWLGDDCFAVVELVSHLVVGWPLYLICNVTGGRRLKGQIIEKPVPFKLGLVDHFRPNSPLFPDTWRIRIALSTLGVLITLFALAVATSKFGGRAVWVHYGMPYLWANFWLVLYTWLQHTDPKTPHYGDEDWTWVKGALGTIDRPYGIFDWMHHHIGSTHVCHHLFSTLPCYHAVEATKHLKAFLEPRGLYNYDNTPWPLAAWRVAKTCHFVEDVHGTQYYQSFGSKPIAPLCSEGASKTDPEVVGLRSAVSRRKLSKEAQCRPRVPRGGAMAPTPRRRFMGDTSDAGVIEDAVWIARLIMEEAKPSLRKASRVLLKLTVLYVGGFFFASNCCFSTTLVPLGVITLAIATGWLQAIGEECKQQRFFPQEILNALGGVLFRWQWTAFWGCILFATNLWQFDMGERVSRLCLLAFVPLSLMLIGQALEPYKFRSARADVKAAEGLVRQLVSAQSSLLESDTIPFYKLGSVSKLLYSFSTAYDGEAKQTLELLEQRGVETSKTPLFKTILKTLYSPFRSASRELLLGESRDAVFYLAAGLYFVLLYIGLPYLPLQAPLAAFCVLLPFLGPKSRASRYLRAIQEDIRGAQARNVEKKGGMSAEGLPEEWPTVINWPMAIYLVGSHAAALYALIVLIVFRGACPLFGQDAPVQPKTLALALALYVFSGLGITAGVHRLWAHRSYKAGAPLKIFLMIANSVANQGSIYHWARDHRVHHRYSDTIADPHNANLGFWYSHIGWLFFKKHPAVLEAGKKVNMEDLKADPIVMFQKRGDPFWNLLWCFAIPAFLAMGLGDTMWNGFLVAGVLRYCLVLNATWAVNSVVHAWGAKPYNASHLTTENGWVSIGAMGEGWHNWHHAFSWDYAAAEMEPHLQWNPTKVFIDAAALIGLAWDRKRAIGVWNLRKQKWEETTGRPVVESMEGPPLFKHRVVTFGPSYEDADCNEEPVEASD